MSTITLTTVRPPEGSLTKLVVRLLAGWRARFAQDVFAGLSEREMQDIGWGQTDRYSRTSKHEA